MKKAMTLLAAFGLDAALGDPHYRWHPAVLIGKLIAALESPVRRRLPDTPCGVSGYSQHCSAGDIAACSIPDQQEAGLGAGSFFLLPAAGSPLPAR